MKDSKIQEILLLEYYKRRHDGWTHLVSKDVGNKIPDDDILRISEQLYDKGLLDWDGVKDETGKMVTGYGKISSIGILHIESVKSAIADKKQNSKMPNSNKILEKLVELMKDPSIINGYESSDNLIAWASKVVPLLQYNPQFQSKFMSYQEIAIVSHLKMQTRQAFQLMKSQVKMAIEELKLMIELKKTDDEVQEKFLPKGFYYDASKALGEIIKSAKSKIFLIDNYIDENILDFFTLKEANVKLFIITKNMKSAMKHYAKQFSLQYGGLEIRISKDYHDRFLIVDETTFYHFGASLKDLGNKAFMFSKIKKESNKTTILENWRNDWLSSNVVI